MEKNKTWSGDLINFIKILSGRMWEQKSHVEENFLWWLLFIL